RQEGRLLPEEVLGRDQDRRRRAAHGRAVGAHSLREPEFLRALFVSRRGALRAADTHARRAQRDFKHPRPLHAGPDRGSDFEKNPPGRRAIAIRQAEKGVQVRRLLILSALLTAVSPAVAEKLVVRVGHFPNITHAQGVIGHGLSRQGKGWFEQRLGPDVEVQWFAYNAGPTAMEAILARSVDLAYVGPNPAVNAHLK